MSEKFSDFQQKCFVRIVENAFYEFVETFWDFRNNVKMFTPNWQIPEKKKSTYWGKDFPFVIQITTENNNQLSFDTHLTLQYVPSLFLVDN